MELELLLLLLVLLELVLLLDHGLQCPNLPLAVLRNIGLCRVEIINLVRAPRRRQQRQRLLISTGVVRLREVGRRLEGRGVSAGWVHARMESWRRPIWTPL